jgi:hypothetical protein
VGFRHSEKRLLTLFLDTLKPGKFQITVKNVAAVDVHGYVYYLKWIMPCGRVLLGTIHIGVGFCVARSTVMGNPGPQSVGRVTVQTLTLFCATI